MAHQAAVLAMSRIANYGLMIISPLVLVRFLTVTDFGRYREFLLFASLLQTAAAFGINDSLLYFVPHYPGSIWRVVRATASLVAAVSVAVVAVFLVIDFLVPRGLIGTYLVPVVLYVLLFVNLDWWEPFWIATRRPQWVLVYSGGRLMARMLVVVCVAVLTKSVAAIIGSLLVLEAVRLAGSAVAWTVADQSRREPPIANIRREQLRFCGPYGFASLLTMLGRNLGNLVIVKYLGAAALAQLTVGSYGDPIILALRNSISQVLLPELVRRAKHSPEEALRLFHRTTVINCMLLFPAAAAVAWYADPLILKLFGAAYRPAIPVLQWYASIIVFACVDFSPLLRAVDKTKWFLANGVVDLLVIGLALVVLLPLMGIVGAIIAQSVARVADFLLLGLAVSRLYGCGWRGLLRWTAVAKVGMCALGGAVIAFGITFQSRATLLGAVCGSVLYGVVFVALLLATRVEGATTIVQWLRTLPAALRRR
ncbi:MAG: oligosaccharide flippase family protein [Steroidobacteraceae bacterium]